LGISIYKKGHNKKVLIKKYRIIDKEVIKKLTKKEGKIK
jgi:hypothetical protein